MTSITQTSSGAKANLVSSSPELLTRPASKPDDRSNSSIGELCTSPMGRRRGDESRFLSARVDLKHSNCFLASNRTDLHFTLDFPTRNQFLKLDLNRPMVAHFTRLQTFCRSGCSACSAYPYEKIRNRKAVGKDSGFRNVEDLSQHFLRFRSS